MFDTPLDNHFMSGNTTFWWSKDSQELLIPFSLGKINNYVMYLAWYDLALDEVDHLLSDAVLSEEGIDFRSSFPLNGLDKVGIFGDKALYIYERSTNEIITVEKDFIFMNSRFLFAPNGPIDLARCPAQ